MKNVFLRNLFITFFLFFISDGCLWILGVYLENKIKTEND